MNTHITSILESFVMPILRGIRTSADRIYRYFRHRPRTAFVVIAFIVVLFFVINHFLSSPAVTTPPSTRSVTLVRAGDESTAEPLTVIGEVRSVKEALISPDSSGTIAGVYHSLGDFVGAGTVLASVKNDRERAAVTQAEAALAKAKAGAAISGIGVSSASNTLANAEKGAATAIQTARATISDSVLRRTDNMFENPTSNNRKFIVTTSAYQLTQQTVGLRAAMQGILDQYADATVPSGTSETITVLEQMQKDVVVAHDYFNTLSQTLGNAIPDSQTSETDISGFRSEANASLSAITALETSLTAAEKGLKDAQAGVAIADQQNTDIDGVSADVIAAQATLQNAQIALDRTLIRTPIAGVVNRLDLNLGDFVAAGTPVAYVTSDTGLEAVAYVNSRDVGDIVRGASATVEGTSIKGSVTRVATALDPATKKAEIRVSLPTNGFVSGQSVTLSIERRIKPGDSAAIFLPLTTVKLTPDGAEIFTVSASSTLEARAVTLGLLEGSSIQIIGGLNPDWLIVQDARGLSDGEIVIVNE